MGALAAERRARQMEADPATQPEVGEKEWPGPFQRSAMGTGSARLPAGAGTLFEPNLAASGTCPLRESDPIELRLSFSGHRILCRDSEPATWLPFAARSVTGDTCGTKQIGGPRSPLTRLECGGRIGGYRKE